MPGQPAPAPEGRAGDQVGPSREGEETTEQDTSAEGETATPAKESDLFDDQVAASAEEED